MPEAMSLDKRLVDEVLKVVRAKFDLDADSRIDVTSIEVDAVEHKIHIELYITTTERPEVLAKSYFGLTGQVRSALGSDWSGFFPVITPSFNSGIHA